MSEQDIKKLKTPTDFKKFFQKIPTKKWYEGYHNGETGSALQACALGQIAKKADKDLDDYSESNVLNDFKNVNKLNKLFVKFFDMDIMSINDEYIYPEDYEYINNKLIANRLKQFKGLRTPRARILKALDIIEKETQKKKVKRVASAARRKVLGHSKEYNDFINETETSKKNLQTLHIE